MRARTTIALVALVGLLATAGVAADGLADADGVADFGGAFQPGLWRITSLPSAIDLPGLDSPEAKAAIRASLRESRRTPDVDTVCVTAADVAAGLPNLLPDADGQAGCTGTPAVVAGGRLSAMSNCASTALALTGRYDADRLAATMTIDTVDDDQAGRVTMAISGVRIGACPADQR